MDADVDVPKNIKKTLYSPEKDQWVLSVESEIMNFIKQKCWKNVKKIIPIRAKRKIMKSTWAFKKKLEQDKSTKFKSQACSKGYEQVPGKDYT